MLYVIITTLLALKVLAQLGLICKAFFFITV